MSYICHTYVIHMSYICHTYVIYVIYIYMSHVASVSFIKRCGFETKLLSEVLPTRASSRLPTSRGCQNPQRSGLNLHPKWTVSMFREIDVRCSFVHSLTLWPEVFRFSSCAEITLFVPVSPCIVDPPDAFFRNQCSQGQVHYPHRSSLSPRSHEDCTVPLLVKSLLAICAHCLRLPELFVECPWPGRVSN